MKRLAMTLAAALVVMLVAAPVDAQVTAAIEGPTVLPEGGLIAVKYGQCLTPDDEPMFTPGNRYCEWQGGHQPDAMPFARTGRFTLTLRNPDSADATPSLRLSRVSPQRESRTGCHATWADTGAFRWRSADLDAIQQVFSFSYDSIPIAANSTRVIRFEMASVRDYLIDGDCMWEFQVDGVAVATLTVEDDEARPYIGPVPGPHPYGASWKSWPDCLIDGKDVKLRRRCVFVE